MQLHSTKFSDQQMIPVKYTCKGENLNPELNIKDVPQATKSLALILHDPDAPSGDFVHWLAWNIPANTTQINTGDTLAGAVQGINDFGSANYGGPCPHAGTHRYVFSLFALDTELDLPQTTTRPQLLKELDGHILAQATLTGLFSADNL